MQKMKLMLIVIAMLVVTVVGAAPALAQDEQDASAIRLVEINKGHNAGNAIGVGDTWGGVVTDL